MESNKKIFRSNSIRTLCTLPLFLLPIAEMNGTTTYAQSVQFSFSLSNSTVKEVLEQIENESEFVFVYYENTFDPSKKVSINANGKEVDEILDEVFAGQGVSYEINDRQVILKKEEATSISSKAVHQQETKKIQGLVKDIFGEPIIGASVVIKGTTNGTITGLDGEFSLNNVEKGSVIQVSFIGYQTQEIAWNGQPLTLTLKEDSRQLEEVIVVGFGTQKKENLTGSVSQVSMDEVLGDRPVTSAAAALQGAMPGLTIGGGSGPGQSKSFNIRGTLSINGGSPLVLIDNVEGDINMLNPEDIESVTVLKDAASSAIYGARAAGGVVLVTTKRPKSGTNFNLNYNFNVGWEKPINVLEQASLLEYIDAYQEAGYTQTYWAGNGDVAKWRDYLVQYKKDPSSLNTIGDGIYKDTDGRVYWLSEKNIYDNILTTGFLNNHNISASGGTDKIRFRLSAGLSKENGPLYTDKDSYYRKNISAFVSADVLKWFTQEITVSYSDAKKKMPERVGNMVDFYSTRLVQYYPEGNMPAEIIGTDEELPTQTPMNMIRYAPVSTTRTAIPRISTRSIFKILPGWSVTAEYTFDRKDVNYDFYSGSFKYADCQLAVKSSIEAGQDYYKLQDEQTRYNAFNLYSNFEKKWGKHSFKAMVGFNQESSYYKLFMGQVKGQTAPSVPSFEGGSGEKLLQDSYSEYAIRSGFARLNYSFNDRYLLELNGRYDGSSKFPKNSRFGFFPSVSLGWRMGQEKFMNWSKSWLDDFKLRASYASIGNQSIDPYSYTPAMNVGLDTVWLDGNDKVSVISLPVLVSSTFTWETVNSFNVGFDVSAFNNRLQIVFDWFKRKTTGMLSEGIEIPSVVGAGAPLQNIADLSSKGWEINLSWRDRIGNFSYNIGFNIYDSRAFIDKFNNESGFVDSNYVGKELGEYWGYVSDGYYTIDDFVLEDAQKGVWTLKDNVVSIQGVVPQPGDEKFKDLDGDNIISPASSTLSDSGDRKVIGSKTPRYQFGANIGVGYKGLSLDVRLQGVGKRDYVLGGAALFPFAGSSASDAVFQPLFYNQTDYWSAVSYDPNDPDFMKAKNPNAKLFRIYDQGNNVTSNTRASDKYIQNAAYLRVKNITLAYSFPKNWVQKAFMKDAKIYLSIENPFTFSSLPKGYDPEGNEYNEIVWNYPYYRTISLGANITF